MYRGIHATVLAVQSNLNSINSAVLPPSLMVYLSPNWSFSGDKWSAVENAFTKWWILQKQICVRMYGFDTGHKSKCENRVSLSFIHITYRWGCSITSACIFPITEPYFGSLLASYCVFDILVDGQIRQSIFALLPHSHFHILWASSKFQLK